MEECVSAICAKIWLLRDVPHANDGINPRKRRLLTMEEGFMALWIYLLSDRKTTNRRVKNREREC
jgi:hypothetical protein